MNGPRAGFVLPKAQAGLVNCLSSNFRSPQRHEFISVIGEDEAFLVTWQPSLAGSCDLKFAGPSDMPGRNGDVVAHAVGYGDVYILASRSTIFVYDLERECLVTRFSCVPTLPRDVACANLNEIGVVIAIAGACGIMIYRADWNSRGNGPCPDTRTPQILPGSYGYPCVSVAISSSSFIAAATVDGRVAIWELLPGSGMTLEAGAATVFEPREDGEMHDRVTELQIFEYSSHTRFKGCSTILAVAWWSGRVDLYKFDDAWSFVRTVFSISSNDMNYSDAPGTYVAFSTDGSVLAVCTGLGTLSFWSIPEGISISSSLISDNRLGPGHVKGFAAVGSGIIAWLCDRPNVIFASFPEPARIANAIGLHAKANSVTAGNDILNGTQHVYMDVDVQVTISNELKCIHHRQSGSKKSARIPFPCNADSIALGHEQELNDSYALPERGDSLSGSLLTASRRHVVFLMNVLVFVYTLDLGEWTVIISRSRLSLCAIAEGRDSSKGLALCVSAEGLGWRWDISTLKGIDPPDSPLSLPAHARSIIGCSRGTGVFAVVSVSPPFVQADDALTEVILTLVDSRSTSGPVVRSCRLPTCRINNGVCAVFSASTMLVGLWCTGSEAVVLVAVRMGKFAAFTIDTRGAELTLIRSLVIQAPPVKSASFGLVARTERLPESMLAEELSSRHQVGARHRLSTS